VSTLAIIFFRTIIIFIIIVAALRFMGKRQLGELELSELVVAVLISEQATLPLQDIGIPLIHGLVSIITLLCCELLITAATLKSLKFRSFICGKPSVIIDEGNIVQSEMKSNSFSLDELAEALRKKDIIDISKVRYAVLETDGTLSICLFEKEQAATPSVMGIDVKDKVIPVSVISDGRVLSDNLSLIGRDESWLRQILSRKGIESPTEVYYMTSDGKSDIFLAAKEIRK